MCLCPRALVGLTTMTVQTVLLVFPSEASVPAGTVTAEKRIECWINPRRPYLVLALQSVQICSVGFVRIR